jgi:hypothetical protein
MKRRQFIQTLAVSALVNPFIVSCTAEAPPSSDTSTAESSPSPQLTKAEQLAAEKEKAINKLQTDIGNLKAEIGNSNTLLNQIDRQINLAEQEKNLCLRKNPVDGFMICAPVRAEISTNLLMKQSYVNNISNQEVRLANLELQLNDLLKNK